MNFGERVLTFLSRDVSKGDYSSHNHCPDTGDALVFFEREFPILRKVVSRKKVLDFGCGEGRQTIALAAQMNCAAVGLDTNQQILDRAKKLAQSYEIQSGKIEFVNSLDKISPHSFDVVISQNSFEHFSDPIAILENMKEYSKPDGKLFISFGPPWFAPYGSHMHYFCKFPWVNIFFSERTVMNVRRKFRNDGASKYEEVESGLNKMSVRKFEKIIASSGLRFCFKKYGGVKRINFLCKIPFLRELFTNRISVILEKG